PVRYLNNIVEQDHRAIKRRVRASQGFRSLDSAARTIQGFETVNMIRKKQVRWLPKDDIAGQAALVATVSRSRSELMVLRRLHFGGPIVLISGSVTGNASNPGKHHEKTRYSQIGRCIISAGESGFWYTSIYLPPRSPTV